MSQSKSALWCSSEVVDLVVSGLVDKMAEDIDDGKSVQLGEFGIFSPTIRAKSADDEKDVSSKSIVQRKIIFIREKSLRIRWKI